MPEVKTETISLDRRSVKAEVDKRMKFHASLSEEEKRSLIDFSLMVCGNIKPDVFTTTSDILHDNRDNIKKNLGIDVLNMEETLELLATTKEKVTTETSREYT